jgi:hypothetical protein
MTTKSLDGRPPGGGGTVRLLESGRQWPGAPRHGRQVPNPINYDT